MWSTWATPSECNPVGHSDGILTKEQVESWREHGFALVDNLIPAQLADQVFEESFNKLSPTMDTCDFGSGGLLEYPCGLAACDQVTLHPNILAAAAQLLNLSVFNLRLTQSDIWMKKGKENSPDQPMSNSSQRVHCGK